MKRNLKTELKKVRSFDGRIFPTRDAALAALLRGKNTDDLDFQITQDGAGRALIKLMVTN